MSATTGEWSWLLRAECAAQGTDTLLFFPDHASDVDADVLRLCASCPVRQQCAEVALANPSVYGIWGGTTERQRAQIRREMGVEP